MNGVHLRMPLGLIVIAWMSVACGGGPTVSLRASSAPAAAASPTPAETASPSASAPTATPAPAPTPTSTPELSTAEADLLENLRTDSRISCAPRRTGLPPGSTVGVECDVDSDLVDRVGVYGFPTEDGLGGYAIGAYLARLDEKGIPLRSGDCADGRPGDASWPDYLPDEGPEGAGPSETRIGCFHDEDGTANIRLTCYGDVYVGILGQGRDIAPLYAWAMRVAAGESTHRDPPGICARPD